MSNFSNFHKHSCHKPSTLSSTSFIWSPTENMSEILSELILPHLKRNLLYGDKLQCLFYTWDSLSRKVTPCSRHAAHIARTTTFLLLGYCLAQVVKISTSTSVPRGEKIQGGIISIAYIGALIIRCEWESDPAIIKLLNLLCHYKSTHWNGN